MERERRETTNDHLSSIERNKLKTRSRNAKIIYYIYGILFTGIFIYLYIITVKIGVIDAWAWKALYEKYQLKDRMAPANRGNIYADDGTALAISVPMYRTYIDFRAGGFSDSLFLNNVDSLSAAMSRYFGDHSKADYKRHLMKGFNERKRRNIFRLMSYEINHTQYKALKEMPYFRIGNSNKTGLVVSGTTRRIKPFNTMASRTIGFLDREVDSLQVSHGSSGLEMGLDSLLCGVPGLDMMIRTGRSYSRKAKIKAIDGKDVYTTINVRIQDITERSLRQMLVEQQADWGCAIVMEVKTGAIKAISNLNRISEGVYMESTNHAVADLLEPGSTFKTTSILLALNDGICNPNDTIDTFSGRFPYAGRTITDHNVNHGGYHKISVAQSIWYSSNIGVARTILKGYEHHPEKYLKGVEEMSFFAPMHLNIPGSAQARINRNVDTWARTSLPWISFGYETQIPPIFTCRFYNAIANDGKMMQPYIVKTINEGNKVIHEQEPEVINKKIASSKAIKNIKAMLRGVVTDGTGKLVNSPYITIAGKTGTALRSNSRGYDRSLGYNISFCGFFPYEEPKYTCMVTICHPRVGYPSSGKICGGVVRNIAEEIFATTMTRDIDEIKPDSTATFDYPIYGGGREAIEDAISITKIKPKEMARGAWLRPERGEEHERLLDQTTIKPQIVPQLIGVAPMDAVYMAEKAGLRVIITGTGPRVVSQSLHPGQKFSGTPTITIRIE